MDRSSHLRCRSISAWPPDSGDSGQSLSPDSLHSLSRLTVARIGRQSSLIVFARFALVTLALVKQSQTVLAERLSRNALSLRVIGARGVAGRGGEDPVGHDLNDSVQIGPVLQSRIVVGDDLDDLAALGVYDASVKTEFAIE